MNYLCPEEEKLKKGLQEVVRLEACMQSFMHVVSHACVWRRSQVLQLLLVQQGSELSPEGRRNHISCRNTRRVVATRPKNGKIV